jgi:hypothetical protein
VLIDQVQVMSVIGRTGGKGAANEDAASFSEGFGWANFDSNSFFKSSEENTREPPSSTSRLRDWFHQVWPRPTLISFLTGPVREQVGELLAT